MRLKNRTECRRAEAFIRREAKPFETTDLAVQLKYTGDKKAAIRGYFRLRDIRIVAAVNPQIILPAALWFPVRTELSGSRVEAVYTAESAVTLDEMLIWVFFHEFHHFLCHSRQRAGDGQIQANAFGFEMLEKFKITLKRRKSGSEPPIETLARFQEPAMAAR